MLKLRFLNGLTTHILAVPCDPLICLEISVSVYVVCMYMLYVVYVICCMHVYVVYVICCIFIVVYVRSVYVEKVVEHRTCPDL